MKEKIKRSKSLAGFFSKPLVILPVAVLGSVSLIHALLYLENKIKDDGVVYTDYINSSSPHVFSISKKESAILDATMNKLYWGLVDRGALKSRFY